MGISTKTHKMLWGRSGNRCAICRVRLVEDETETDDPSVIGEECHIVADKPTGPRGASSLTAEQRDLYNNLILLCRNHHKVVDDQCDKYTVEELTALKARHLRWVEESLNMDAAKQRDEEIYAAYIDEWGSRMRLNEWKSWTSWLLGGDPELWDEMKVALDEVRPWLLSRPWPRRYPELEAALQNFMGVAQDLHALFGRYAERQRDGNWRVPKFYKTEDWDPETYKRLSKVYDAHVALLQDLVLELTRAANYVCDAVRNNLQRGYRLDEGVLLVESGPSMDMSFKVFRVEYHGPERTDAPYPGLKAFDSVRLTRDRWFGRSDEVGVAA